MGWFFKSKEEEGNDIKEKTETNNSEPVEILNTLLSSMKCEAAVDQSVDEMSNIVLSISTNDAARIIGEKGETLYSLQYLLNKILYVRNRENPKVFVDVDQYRSKRKEKLISMARQAADRVIKSGKCSFLPLLNSYERKIIHESLNEDEQVATDSKGEGYYKKIYISLKE